jgi:receptor protein-tyrosine kinase
MLTEPDGSADVLLSLRRRWPMVIIVAAVVTLSAWALAELQPKRYRAESVAALAPTTALTATDVLRSVESLDRRNIIATVAVLATTPLTRAQALAAAPGADGDYVIDTRVLPNTNLFAVSVEGSDPMRVAGLANKIPELVSAQTFQMYRIYGVTIVSAAKVPTTPFSPRVPRAIAAGLAFGLLLGVGIAYGGDRFRRGPRTPGR